MRDVRWRGNRHQRSQTLTVKELGSKSLARIHPSILSRHHPLAKHLATPHEIKHGLRSVSTLSKAWPH